MCCESCDRAARVAGAGAGAVCLDEWHGMEIEGTTPHSSSYPPSFILYCYMICVTLVNGFSFFVTPVRKNAK